MPSKALQQDYNYYNNHFFYNQLSKDIKIIYKSRAAFKTICKRKTDGAYVVYRCAKSTRNFKYGAILRKEIWILDKLQYIPVFQSIVLLHEMTHAYLDICGLQHFNHGIHFKNERRRLIMMGAYDDLL
jgi:hypothetical protein